VVALDRVQAEAQAIALPAGSAAEHPLRVVAAVGDVSPALRGSVVEADVVQEGGDQQHFAVDLPAAVGGELLADQEAADAVALHRPVGLAGELAHPCERVALIVGGRERVGFDRCHRGASCQPRPDRVGRRVES
jgi:hypothetical protein